MAYVETDGTPELEYTTPPSSRAPAPRAYVDAVRDEIVALLGGSTPGPYALTGSIRVSDQHAILRWQQSTRALHYRVFADGVGGADLGDQYDVDIDAGALTVDVPKRFYVRAWIADENAYRDTAEVVLTRVGLSGPTIVHHVAGTTPESGTAPGLVPSVGPALAFTRASAAMQVYHDGTWRRVASGQPCFADISRAENLFANSDAPANQTLSTLPCGQYRVEVWGTGSVTLAGTVSSSGAVSEAGGAVIFDHYAQNTDVNDVAVTISGTLTKFMLTAGTEEHQYVASGTIRYGYVPGKRGRMRLTGGETPVGNFPYGAKGPTTWDNLALADRSLSTSRAPWLARMYEFKESAAAGIHGSRVPLTLGAGTYYLLVYISADVTGDRSVALGIQDSGGTRWAFINPTTGTINATPTEGSPITTGFGCARQPDGGYRITWTHTGSQSITFRNYHVNGANATTIAALTFTGSTSAKTRSIGWFLKSGAEWIMPQLYADGARAQEYCAYTLTDEFDTAGATIRLRTVFVAGPAAANRTLCAGGNMTLRRNASGYIELVVGAMTLTHGTVIADGVEVSIAVRVKAGDYAIAVDNTTVATSTNAATPSAITTLYRGVDTSLANPSHEEWLLFELHADAHSNATLSAWTVAQGTGGAPQVIIQKFIPAAHGGVLVRVPQSWATQTVRGQVTSGTTNLQQLQSIATRNSNNGFSGIKGVVLVFPWSEIQPTATTWNWVGVDACADWLDAQGLSYWVQVQDRNFWRAGVTVPAFVTTRTALNSAIGAKDSAALDLASVMDQKRQVNAAVCNRLRSRALFMGLMEPETSLSTMTDLGIAGKAAHWANLTTQRSTLSAAFTELVFMSAVNGMNLEKWRFEQQADSCISLGNCGFTWPDSPTSTVYQVPIADNNLFWYHFQIARTAAYARKMAIIPGVQNQQIQGNLAEVSGIVDHLIAVENAHAVIMEPDFTNYPNWWTEVVLEIAATRTFNRDIPWTSAVET
jgi:hypothetical protein